MTPQDKKEIEYKPLEANDLYKGIKIQQNTAVAGPTEKLLGVQYRD